MTVAEMETWEYVGTRRVYVPVSTVNGSDWRRQKMTRQGQKVRVDPQAREEYENYISDLDKSIFRNGSLRRVDKPEENTEAASSTQEDLAGLFSRRGKGFQAAVRKLEDEPLRRLLVLATERDVTVAQQKFLDEYKRERFPLRDGPTSQYERLAADRDVIVSDTLE